jgi:hypothetical protein
MIHALGQCTRTRGVQTSTKCNTGRPCRCGCADSTRTFGCPQPAVSSRFEARLAARRESSGGAPARLWKRRAARWNSRQASEGDLQQKAESVCAPRDVEGIKRQNHVLPFNVCHMWKKMPKTFTRNAAS